MRLLNICGNMKEMFVVEITSIWYSLQVTYVDIGAHVGYFAQYVATLGFPVVVVEPQPLNWPRIHKGVKNTDT